MKPRGAATYQRIEHHDQAAFMTSVTLAETELGNGCSTVLLAPHMVGICRSDLREISGTRYERRDFGHEIAGTVFAAPPALADLHGRTVLFDPHPALTGRTSGFAEIVELTGEPQQLHAALVPVPAGLPDRIAVFGEPLACAVHCVTRMHEVTAELAIDPHSPIAVVGAGMAGTLISAVLTAQRHRCVLVNRKSERIEFLRDRRALPPEMLRPVPRHTQFNRVVLATAAATPDYLVTCRRMLADAGALLIFAGTQPGSCYLHGIDIDPVRRNQLARTVHGNGRYYTVAGTYGATRADFLAALSLLSQPSGTDGWSLATCAQRLTTRIVGLAEAADCLTASAVGGVLGKTIVQIHPAIHRES